MYKKLLHSASFYNAKAEKMSVMLNIHLILDENKRKSLI